MASALRVLGIDPGLTRCGVGVVDVARDRSAALVHVGVVRSVVDLPIAERLATIAAGLRQVIAAHRPDVVAVERVFAQQNRATVMGTAQASGVALLLAAEHGLAAATHTPSEVKAAITGYGSADKRQVQTMVARVLRLDVLPQPADAADALAIALCHAWRRAAPGAGAAVPGGADDLTPAQRAWAEAERAAARR
ncbi:crossover junction endodeoxyribonuclease RuvC [Microbacterium lacticum]